MGKRGLSGISRFLQDAFTENNKNEVDLNPRPAKRLKQANWVESYDVTGLVPNYEDESEVPEHLIKYFSQRARFFSRSGCLLDEEGWYSITPERIANQIAERCRCTTILDAFCGVGGNAIAFAQTCERVIALDISPTRLALARHNAQIYGVAHRIEFILADYISFAKAYVAQGSRDVIDVVFLSPPWGGPSYLSGTQLLPGKNNEHPEYNLDAIRPIHGAELFQLTRKISTHVAYYLPRNTSLDQISALLPAGDTESEYVEVEEEWMGNKMKALTCYFGGLVEGNTQSGQVS